MELVNDLFKQLHNRYSITQYDYSRTWLKKGKGYFAYLQSSKQQPNVDVLIAILGEAMKQRALWESSAEEKRGTDKAVYKQHADYFTEIERSAENAIKQHALRM